MNEQEVIDLMKGSANEEEWNSNCDAVKKAFRGYPDFWYSAIVLSGVARDTAAKWSGDSDIHVTNGRRA